MEEYIENSLDAHDDVYAEDLPNFRLTSIIDPADEIDEELLDGDLEVNSEVKHFVLLLNKHLKAANVPQIHRLYEIMYNQITEQLYEDEPWPELEVVAHLVGEEDELFKILYQELYYRHIYSKHQPTPEQRIDCWVNYCALFDLLLADTQGAIQLPSQWLWDIGDEFVYQFQAFAQYRANLKTKNQEELDLLQEESEAWNTFRLLEYLEKLVAQSDVVNKLKAGETLEEDTKTYLGYFSMIGLMRLHCLFGNYYEALLAIDSIDLSKKGLYSKVSACYITLYYYLGFVYLVSRRYLDAIKTFSTILVYIARVGQYHTRSYQYDQMMKKNEQMYALLAITLAICPSVVDDNLSSTLREKYFEKTTRMQRGEWTVYEELFFFAAPKFVSPVAPNYEGPPENLKPVPLKQQYRAFLVELKEQHLLSTVRSYLKLYTSLPLSKLATFLQMDEETVKMHLLCYKHKTHALVWTGGSPSSGTPVPSSDVNFRVQGDMIHIEDSPQSKHYGNMLIRHISKFQEIQETI